MTEAAVDSSHISLKGQKSDDQNLIVALRIRPMTEDEILQGATPIAHCVDEKMVVLMDPLEGNDDILRANRTRERQFMFDAAFDGTASQKEVYEKTSKALIPSVINGYNATVFAYGATGAGKTYTMLGTDDDPGIMAHALNDLFLEMDKSRDSMKYSVRLSYLEIYNEMIRDLLHPETGYLDLREDAKGVQIAGLTEVNAKCTREVMEILIRGNLERTQEPTAANKASSRSHAVLQIAVQQQSRVRDVTQQIRTGKFFLVDLAGSERAANTQNRGKRMVEGAHINRSLLALGNCINALSSQDKTKLRYINYRDSKLTRLLKDSLGGNCKTIMIAHVSPASLFFEESRNTLVYADRAKHIKTKVRRNVADVTYHLAQYHSIIQDLKEEIKRLHRRLEKQASSHHTIHSVHNAVMEDAKKDGEGSDLDRLRTQLMRVFDSQTALRQSVLELNSTGMDVSMDIYRNQTIIQKWEREKELAAGRKLHFKDEDRLRFEEKRLEKHGGSTDELEDPDDVAQAKEHLQALTSEREMAEKVKEDLQKQVVDTRQKASQLEEAFPKSLQSDEQREIVRLLCRAQELQVENMDMQSTCVLRNFEIAKRDMAVKMFKEHKDLCHEIIVRQKALIDEHQLNTPKALDDLLELYQQEYDEFSLPDINAHKELVNSTADTTSLGLTSGVLFPKLFTPVSRTDSRTRRQVLKNASYNLAKYADQKDKDERFFSPSPIARQIQQQQKQIVSASTPLSPVARQKSIVTLSSHSNLSTPMHHRDHRDLISNNTRNIVKLAAKRRTTRAQQYNTLDKYDLSDAALNRTNISMLMDKDSHLTESRLALHDKNFGSSLTIANDEQRSVLTDNQVQARLRKNNQLRVLGKDSTRSRVNYGPQAKYNQMSPEEFFHQLARGGNRRPNDSINGSVKESIRPARRNRHQAPPHLRHASHPPVKVKANLHKTQLLFSEDNESAERVKVGQGKKSKGESNKTNADAAAKKNASISGYRNGDISITGFGIQ